MKALLLGSIAFASLSSFAASPSDEPRVLLEEIKPIEDKQRIIVPVKVEAKIQSTVAAETEGHATRILKPLGSTVKAGEVVLYLENKDPGFTYAAVPIRSPVAGVISQFYISQMSRAVRGDKLFTVINPKSLKLCAEFPSSELGVVQTGLKGLFKMDSSKETGLPIKIVGISPLVDARTGTASAEIEFENSKEALPPIGTIGQAQFEINKGSIFMIPEASLVFHEGKPMVRILKGQNQIEKKLIELGEQRDTSFIVKSGITRGDKIVVRSSRPIKENDTIEIETPAEATR
jgi:multidrug efflux pump subunit AcrA (membrane-fusion protein)